MCGWRRRLVRSNSGLGSSKRLIRGCGAFSEALRLQWWGSNEILTSIVVRDGAAA